MTAMTMYYYPKYDNPIFNFMNFNENLKIGERKSEKIKQVNLQNDYYLGNQKP